ncbi:MAG: methyltransferase domain-containing protein [Haliangiales bacterium]
MATDRSDERSYLLGTDDDELARLSRQHALWLSDALAHWHQAGFGPGDRLLDLGCGPGFAARALAGLLGPAGEVIAVDRSARYISYARSQVPAPGAAKISYRVGDAEQLELADGSLDGAYARWVFTFIAEPGQVIEHLARALRPGARLAIHDYIYWPAMCWGPRDDTLAGVVEAIKAAYRASGAIHSAGRYLPPVLTEHGFDIVELTPLNKIVRPHMAMWWWPESYLRHFLPQVVEKGFLASDDMAAWEAEWAANAADPAGFFMTPPQVAIVARKRG